MCGFGRVFVNDCFFVFQMVELPQPSTSQSQLLVLRDLAIALSACIYQSLCDSDTFKSSLQDSQVSAGFYPIL